MHHATVRPWLASGLNHPIRSRRKFNLYGSRALSPVTGEFLNVETGVKCPLSPCRGRKKPKPTTTRPSSSCQTTPKFSQRQAIEEPPSSVNSSVSVPQYLGMCLRQYKVTKLKLVLHSGHLLAWPSSAKLVNTTTPLPIEV